MNQLFAEPILLLALLVMVALATIPQRYPRVTAVIGWALLWADNKVSGHWSDWLGAIVVVVSLSVVILKRRPPTGPGRRQV